ncbi:hypothetical protein GH714_032255 [Hevea brasiliensis]|uniref:EF-hand domain-containing protein n=1 Tax=Hevea brasiliensis TaxID=3981 RepID=A0A6A6L544_HEVBR|nr:hypothetical protein GH714_032255 [Hevea brasiliensis]
MMAQALLMPGAECCHEQINQMITDADKDGSGAIDFDEFVLMMMANIGERDTKEELMKAFRIIDQDNNVREIYLLMTLSENFIDREIREMVDEANRGRDGEVSVEFIRIMKRTTYGYWGGVQPNVDSPSYSEGVGSVNAVAVACSALGAFGIGKEIHCVVLRTGTARALIDRIPQPDLVSWNALLAGYSFLGLQPFRMLDIGKSLHCFAVKSGYLVNDFLVPALISMYIASDMHLSAARNLFDFVPEKNVAVWNAIISAYVQKQMPFEAFEIFQKMLIQMYSLIQSLLCQLFLLVRSSIVSGL